MPNINDLIREKIEVPDGSDPAKEFGLALSKALGMPENIDPWPDWVLVEAANSDKYRGKTLDEIANAAPPSCHDQEVGPVDRDGAEVTWKVPVKDGVPYYPDMTSDPDPQTEDFGWYLSSTVLNIFWGDVLPRYAALVWKEDGLDWPDVGTDLWCLVWDHMDTLTKDASNEFQARVGVLKAYYLLGASAWPRPAFLYAGEGGFDFILSDRGVEVFAPPPPNLNDEKKFKTELARYYSFRSTGRAPITLPGFLDPGPPRFLDPAISPIIAATLPQGFGMIDFVRGGTSMPAMDGASQVRGENVKRLVNGGDLLEEARGWEISGAVFRAIVEHTPRIVAEIWVDELEGGPSEYRKRWTKPEDDGLRMLAALRVETALPPQEHMDFFNGVDAKHPALPWGPDIGITARGLHFPYVEDCPSREAILDSIIEGRSGNPVFTASSQTS